MNQLFRLLWAKCSQEKNTSHLLIYHLLDTSAMAAALWNSRAVGQSLREKFSWQLRADPKEAAALFAWLAGLHDLGKASPCFQIRENSPVTPKAYKEAGLHWDALNLKSIHHGHITFRALYDLLNSQGIDPASSKRISQILAGHHGVFPNIASLQKSTSQAEIIEKDAAWQQLRQELFQILDQQVRGVKYSRLELSGPQNLLPVLLAAFTSISDWLASNTDFFPYCQDEIDFTAYFANARQKAEAVIERLAWNEFTPPDSAVSFEELFPWIEQPRPLQSLIEEIAGEDLPPKLVVIEAPMGEGKTEAAFLMQDNWCRRFDQRGAYIALPTMAASNQMFQRFREFLALRYPRQRLNYLLLHSQALVDENYAEMLKQSPPPASEEEEEDTSLFAQEWFTMPKRGFLAPLAVGTVDQALMSVLQTRYGYIRLFGLADKTLIFDEVHAYDTYMNELFVLLLKWLKELETTVVLLSATLPRERLKKLVATYAQDPNGVEVEKYPRLSWVDADGKAFSKRIEVELKKEVQVGWLENSPGQISELLQCKLASGGCAALVCNSVDRAQQSYRMLREQLAGTGIDLVLFHARFTHAKRAEIEKQVLESFGRKRRANKTVLVATQVVEQSLDLDFDLMLSEFAPADLLLQRVGRLHRHGRARPPGLERPGLLLFNPPSGQDGKPVWKGTVYDEYIMLRSWLVLRKVKTLRIPEDVEEIIERVYGELQPEVPEELVEQYRELAQAFCRRQEQLARRALKVLIPEPAGPRDILRQWNRQLEEDNPDVAEQLRAQTRLAGPSVNIVCLHSADGKLYLNPECTIQCSLHCQPDQNTAKEFYRTSINLSYYGCQDDFPETEVPGAWKKTALLRHSRVLVFVNRRASKPSREFVFDDELGLVYLKKSG